MILKQIGTTKPYSTRSQDRIKSSFQALDSSKRLVKIGVNDVETPSCWLGELSAATKLGGWRKESRPNKARYAR